MKITKKTAIALIILLIMIVSIFHFMTYAPKPPNYATPIVECQKNEKDYGIYFNVSNIDNEGGDADLRLMNFELGLRNNETLESWDLNEIDNTNDGPKFIDADGCTVFEKMGGILKAINEKNSPTPTLK